MNKSTIDGNDTNMLITFGDPGSTGCEDVPFQDTDHGIRSGVEDEDASMISIKPESNMDRYAQKIRFLRRFRKYVARKPHKNMTLCTLTLTFPEWAHHGVIYPAAFTFAKLIARDKGATVWLALDESEKERLHWHGIVISPRDGRWLMSKWSELTGAKKVAMNVQPITGQDESWDCRKNRKLKGNLNTVVWYHLTDLPTVDVPLRYRVIAAGEIEDVWKRVTGTGSADPNMEVKWLPPSKARAGKVRQGRGYARGSSGEQVDGEDVRICARPGCGKTIPPGKRKDAKYHDDKCRTRDSRDRSATEIPPAMLAALEDPSV